MGVRRAGIRLGLALATAGLVSACSMGSFPSMGNFGTPRPSQDVPGAGQAMPTAAGQTVGKGPVRVAMLLPLSGDPALAGVGTAMSNSAQLAMSFIEANPNIAENITLVIKDTGPTAAGAAQKASEAVNEGASLILGPLRADQVQAAGGVARSAGLTLIGFSNNTGAAAPGVFLLNVLPETEVRRSVGYVQGQGKRSFAAIVPTTAFGRIQEGAFRQAVADLGLTPRAIYSFTSQAEAEAAVKQAAPFLKDGSIDALFIPDRATATSLATFLFDAGIPPGKVQLIGSADWDGDTQIVNAPYLAGAIYPSVDGSGLAAIRGDYQARFGGQPHPLSTIAYTATLLANTSSLALGNPRYDRTQLVRDSGFNGRDGLFRFQADGRSDYALVIKRVGNGSAQQVDGPKL